MSVGLCKAIPMTTRKAVAKIASISVKFAPASVGDFRRFRQRESALLAICRDATQDEVDA